MKTITLQHLEDFVSQLGLVKTEPTPKPVVRKPRRVQLAGLGLKAAICRLGYNPKSSANIQWATQVLNNHGYRLEKIGKNWIVQ